MNRNTESKRQRKEYDSRAVDIRRVMKTISQGNRLRFRTVVVVGDRKGSVGVGLGRGADTRMAVDKGYNSAVKKLYKVQLVGDTIPHEVVYKYRGAKVLLRPARPGTGIIAGSSVRTVLELCGVDNVYGKILGSRNPVANAYCTFEALKQLRNGRVLERMRKMKERISLKEEIEKEKKKRKAAAQKDDTKKSKADSGKKQSKASGKGSRSPKQVDKAGQGKTSVSETNKVANKKEMSEVAQNGEDGKTAKPAGKTVRVMQSAVQENGSGDSKTENK